MNRCGSLHNTNNDFASHEAKQNCRTKCLTWVADQQYRIDDVVPATRGCIVVVFSICSACHACGLDGNVVDIVHATHEGRYCTTQHYIVGA